MAAGDSRWYSFVRWLVKTAFFWPLGGIRTVGEINVPKSGPLIVAPVHLSLLDPPGTACGMSRQLSFMAKEELFKGLFGKIISSVGAFPIRRGEGDTESIRTAISRLQDGRALLLFPEGTRGDGRTLGALNRGVAMLAKRTDAPVIPVAIVGTHVMWPRGQKRLKRHGIVLEFGTPFRYSELATAGSERENRRRFGAELERQLIELCAKNGLKLRTSDSGSDSAPASDPVAST